MKIIILWSFAYFSVLLFINTGKSNTELTENRLLARSVLRELAQDFRFFANFREVYSKETERINVSLTLFRDIEFEYNAS